MKNIILIIVSIFLFGITTNGTAQSKNMDNFTVQVDGLGCPFCAYGLEKKFKELKGIKEVKIEMETGIMDFEYPADKQLSIAQVEQQVEKAGYTPVRVAITRADGKVENSAKTSTITDTDEELKSIAFFVAGNCNMCKSRIENAAKKLEGIQSATWDKATKQLTVKATSSIIPTDLEKAIAKAGHDTENIKANQSTYNDLPGCCQYERL